MMVTLSSLVFEIRGPTENTLLIISGRNLPIVHVHVGGPENVSNQGRSFRCSEQGV